MIKSRAFFMYTVLGALALTERANASDYKTIHFASEPSGAIITVADSTSADAFSNQIHGQCQTPCSLRLVRAFNYMDFRMTKKGYETRTETNFLIGKGKKKKTKKLLVNGETIKWVLEQKDVAVIAADNVTDAKPIYRSVPKAPKSLKQKEKCLVEFNIDEQGVPFDVTVKCNLKKLEKRSVKAVKKWQYYPKTVNAVPVKRIGMKANLVYRPPEKF